jgi:2-polyprenyl-3-methyl-5-hydroxy-6-metoxy-1,4-benzoquinol methylase
MCDASDPALLTSRERDGRVYLLARCRKCGQHFCSPTPTAAEIASFYEGDYHQSLRVKGGSESTFGKKFERYRDWVLRYVPRGRSLDIGSSTGLFPSLLKQAGYDAEGLEFNAASAAWGQTHYGIRIRTCALEETGERPGSFKLISMTDVLEHTENPLRYLKMASGYLESRGFMLITFPDVRSPESLYLRFMAMALARDWIWRCCHIPLHVWEFTPATARAMFDKAGFEVVAFRRSQHVEDVPAGHQSLALLRSPLKLLKLPVVEAFAGTQMQFIIRKRS